MACRRSSRRETLESPIRLVEQAGQGLRGDAYAPELGHALRAEPFALVLDHRRAEAVDGPQWRAHVVGDRVGQRLELSRGGVELLGAADDALPQLVVERRI